MGGRGIRRVLNPLRLSYNLKLALEAFSDTNMPAEMMETTFMDRKWTALLYNFCFAAFIGLIAAANGQVQGQVLGEVESLAYSPDGSKIAIASGPFTCDDPDNPAPDAYAVSVLDVTTGQIEKRFRGSTCALVDVAWSPDGTKIATSSFNGHEAFIWDVASETLLATSNIHAEVGIEVVWSPDSTRIASTFSGGKYAVVWDASTGEILFKLGEHADFTTSVSWSPDGNRMATSSLDNTAIIWNTATQQSILTLSYTDQLYWASWSPDGTKISTASRDGNVQVWDSTSGRLLTLFQGHTNSVERVVWNPDGTEIASGSLDGTIRVWEIRTGQEVSIIQGKLGPIVDVAWSPDGSKLAYIGRDSGNQSVPVEIVLAPTSDQTLLCHFTF